MALRLVQVDIGESLAEEAAQLLDEAGAAEVWTQEGGAFGSVICAVMGAERTGNAVDLIYERLSPRGRLRALVLSLDAVVPRPAATRDAEGRQERISAAAVSREETYASIAGGAELSSVFIAMVILATVVAAIGLSTDNTAAVIGAMVVAPLLGPNMALALGLTLGDKPLIVGATKSGAVGLTLCLGVATSLAYLLEVDPTIPELASRTTVRTSDVVLAVAAGAAGTLAYTTGAPTYLVGVMVAVALLPPMVAGGLFLGHGYLPQAMGALLLAGINSVALVFASMVTLQLAGMRPRAWWKEERARRSARRGVAVLVALLILLGGLVYLSNSLVREAALR